MAPPTVLINNTSTKSFYESYLGSSEWQVKRAERLRVDGYKCTRCGSEEYLNVHHLTYVRLGNERIEDLLTLCRDCHKDTHGIAIGDFKKFKRQQKRYRETFIEAHGQFPHLCCFCNKLVDGYTRPFDTWAAVVHHQDGDRRNNDPSNLKPAHHGCHMSHHHKGRKHTPKEIAKRAKGIRQAYANRTEEQVAATNARMKAMIRKAWDNPESREKLVQERRERAQRPGERARLIEMAAQARTTNWQNDEYRARASARGKELMANPEYRANAVANLQRTFEQRSTQSKRTLHKRWHLNRGIVNPNCELCIASLEAIDDSTHDALR